jgi:hypothetical protein
MRLFSSPVSRPPLGATKPPIQWASGVVQTGHEANHSPLSSALVKMTWIYTSTPQPNRHDIVLLIDSVSFDMFYIHVMDFS